MYGGKAGVSVAAGDAVIVGIGEGVNVSQLVAVGSAVAKRVSAAGEALHAESMMSRGTMNSLYFIFHRLKSMQTEF